MNISDVKSITCERCATLLSRQTDEPLTKKTAKQVSTHLAQCSDCRRLAAFVEQIPAAMQDDLGHIKPDPVIALRLQARFRRHHASGKNASRITLGSVLRYRVPLYQAALGIGLFLMIVFWAGRGTVAGDPTRDHLSVPVQLADTTYRNAADDSVNTGRSLYEDSLLTRFLQATM